MPTTRLLNILGVKFPVLGDKEIIRVFQDWITSKTPRQVCFVNVHALVSSLSDPELRAVYERTFNAMDGLPLVWYANAVHGAGVRNRLSGPEVMLQCLDEGRKLAWKHFFLGGAPQVAEDLAAAMQQLFPGVQIAGWHSPPFTPLSGQEVRQLADLINRANPDFLWVGLGAPKQEKWIAAHLQLINAPVQLGVGAAFDFHSGHVRRAPVWMRENGLEWLFRMLGGGRLFKRYLTTNPVFLFLFARDYIAKRLLKRRI